MKFFYSSIMLFLLSMYNAQIKFEKGYIVDSNGQKQEVLIKNLDWFNSPKDFVYKINESSPEQTGTPSNIKEFGAYGYTPYISYTGLINISPTEISAMSSKKEPELTESTIFLKQLTSGDKKLYSYKGENIVNYFYSDENNDPDLIKLLVYKKYHPDGNNMLIAINEDYKDQLQKIFPDKSKVIYSIRYTDDLKKLFNTNESSDNTALVNANNKKINFNLNIRPGINFYSESKFDLFGNQELPSTTNFRIGVEGELILPSNKNKFSIILEPSYAIYTSKDISKPSGNTNYSNHKLTLAKYSFVDLPIGLRYYMFLNDKSKFFVNAQFNTLRAKISKSEDIAIKDGDYTAVTEKLASVKLFNSFVLGAGFNYNNKYSIEVRYNTASNIVDNSDGNKPKITYFSIILGYNIF